MKLKNKWIKMKNKKQIKITEKNFTKQIGAVIYNTRIENEWTQIEFAKRLGVGQSTLSKIEMSAVLPSRKVLFILMHLSPRFKKLVSE